MDVTPGNISASGVTSTSISIQIANGMIGNWDYIRVYAYNHDINPSYKDISKIDYDNGTRIVTWTGLTTDLEYKFNAVTYFTINETLLQSAYWSNDLYVTASSRPDNFSWDTPKVQGENINLTATEWTNLQYKINQFRLYKGLGNYSFTTVVSEGIFYASLFNEVRNKIGDMNTVGLPSTKVGISDVVDPNDADYILASDLNGLKDALNAIT